MTTVGWSHRKAYESSVFQFSLSDQISDVLPRKFQRRSSSMSQGIRYAARSESGELLTASQSEAELKTEIRREMKKLRSS
jgi:hypothetical protein